MVNCAYSIIIPIYNGEVYLLNNLLSERNDGLWGGVLTLINPRNTPFEIIFVDDGSQDQSKEIISDLCKKCSNIRLFSRENKGNLRSRIDGARHAKGDYILFFDQDDLFRKDLIVKLDEVREKFDPDIISFRYHSTDSKTIFHESRLLHPNELVLDRNVFMTENCTTMWNKAFKRQLFLKANIQWDCSYAFDEDRNLVAILRSEANSQFDLDEDLYTWMIHGNGLHDQLVERINAFVDYRFQEYCLDHIRDKVSKKVFQMELNYAVGHCYEGIALIALSKTVHLKKRVALLKSIRGSSCFKRYLGEVMFSKEYLREFGFKTKTVIRLYKHRLYPILFLLGKLYSFDRAS